MADESKPPRMVADQLLWRRSGVSTTPMQVLKLTYLCHGWMLGVFKRALINEPVEAWRYGPVVPSIYHAYKSFGRHPIETELVDRTGKFDAEQRSLIDAVLEAYKDYTAWQLSAITHQPDTPWAKVYGDGRGEGAIIPDRLILSHYEDRVRNG